MFAREIVFTALLPQKMLSAAPAADAKPTAETAAISPTSSEIVRNGLRRRIGAQANTEASEQARGKAAQGPLAVGVVGVELGEEGQRHAVAPAPEERHLVVDPTGAAPPSALQVELPAARHDAADTPALGADHVREQEAGVRAVGAGDIAHQVVHETDLIARAGSAQAPDLPVVEVAHAGDPGQPLDPPSPDQIADLGRRDAVGAANHRRQQRPVCAGQAASVAHSQERGEQHHLEDAGGRRRARRTVTVVAAPLIDHGEGDLAEAPPRIAAGGCDIRSPGRGACGNGARTGSRQAKYDGGRDEEEQKRSLQKHSPSVCHHRRLAAVTFMYCYPTVLETDAGCAAVDDTLASLAAELELDDGVQLRTTGGNSIVVTGIEPKDLWRAMDRAVPDWEDRRLFFAPVFL
jgi:hypothetical protein